MLHGIKKVLLCGWVLLFILEGAARCEPTLFKIKK